MEVFASAVCDAETREGSSIGCVRQIYRESVAVYRPSACLSACLSAGVARLPVWWDAADCRGRCRWRRRVVRDSRSQTQVNCGRQQFSVVVVGNLYRRPEVQAHSSSRKIQEVKCSIKREDAKKIAFKKKMSPKLLKNLRRRRFGADANNISSAVESLKLVAGKF